MTPRMGRLRRPTTTAAALRHRRPSRRNKPLTRLRALLAAGLIKAGVIKAGRVACVAAVAGTACGVLSPEEQLLTRFFEASRVYDTAVMARLSAVPLNPRTDGIVDSFDISGVDRSDKQIERVTVAAKVRAFDGRVRPRQLVFTVTHRDGHWFIQNWR